MKRARSRAVPPAAAASPPPFIPPYSPSWINRLADRVERLPGPAWGTYVGAAFLLTWLQLAIQWSAGTYPPGTIDWFTVVVAVTVPYLLGLMHYLIRTSAAGFDEFRPALRATPAEAEGLRFRMTVLPARPVLLVSAVFTAACSAAVLLTYALEQAGWGAGTEILGGNVFRIGPQVFHIAPTAPSIGLTTAILLSSWWAISTYAYLMVRQLRLISSIYVHNTEIRLFRLGPLYAFSRHTLRSALGLLVLAYALFATAPEVLSAPLGRGSWLLLVAGAIATFLLPLLGIHRALVREKGRMLNETGARFEAGAAQLHDRMDDNRLERMDELNLALASLEIERAALERVPTWPWERGTVRSLVAALVIPLILWLAQTLLQRGLGG